MRGAGGVPAYCSNGGKSGQKEHSGGDGETSWTDPHSGSPGLIRPRENAAVEPLNTGEPPARETIRRALRVAEEICAYRPGPGRPHADVWLGSADALRWILGSRAVTPLSGQELPAGPDGAAALAEIDYADACFHGGRLPVGGAGTTAYVLGVQDALIWVLNGNSFADTLHDDELRSRYAFDPTDSPVHKHIQQ